jgi:hypothetical protein
MRQKQTMYAVILLAAILSGAQVSAQEPATKDAASYEQGWYVVRPGDTLQYIARLYLGTSQLWRLNLSLNPTVSDPNLLFPGQLLRIVTRPALPPRTAKVLSVSKDVEKNPVPLSWSDAATEDLLLGDDGVRTLRNSSTELRLADGTELTVTENSLVFLKKAETRVRQTQTIEIVHGQADLEMLAAETGADEIEIVLGTAMARPKGGSTGNATRARRPEQGGSQVMVFHGKSDVEAGGKTVQVAEGMGTAVPEKGPPAPPERLLTAPVTVSPPPGTRLSFANPTLIWEEVAKARSYTTEVCLDPDCGQLVERQTDVNEASLTMPPLPVGDLYWRVTAVSASGLDGFPSTTVPFTILDPSRDTTPPTGSIHATGAQHRLHGHLYLGLSASLEVDFEDAESGPDTWKGLLDGEQVTAAEWAGPWTEGKHLASAEIFDRAGNSTQLEPLAFTYDVGPPEITCKVVPIDWSGHRGVAARVWPEGGSRSGGPPLRWSIGGGSWRPLGNTMWRLEDPDAHVVLRATSGSLRLAEPGVESRPGQVILIEAPDSGSGLARLRFGATREGEGSWKIVIEATDNLGLTSTVEWSQAVSP